MKAFLLAPTVLVLSLLAGCSPAGPEESVGPEPETVTPSESAVPEEITWTIPVTCELDSVLASIENNGFPGVVDLNPAWSPAAGTDLAAALDAGGIACGYGIPETDAGVTAYWVPNAEDVFEATAQSVWIPEGATIVDLDLSIAEVATYYVQVDGGTESEFPHWEVNVIFDGGLWLQLATSSWSMPNDGNAIIEAMLEVATP